MVYILIVELLFFFRALAKNCNSSIDDKDGAEAKDWRKGKPVRVVSDAHIILRTPLL